MPEMEYREEIMASQDWDMDTLEDSKAQIGEHHFLIIISQDWNMKMKNDVLYTGEGSYLSEWQLYLCRFLPPSLGFL